jgi:ATP-dependent DNA helicase RecQ
VAGRALDWSAIRALAAERFGVERFRRGQRELVEAALLGEDALGVLPTGAGKSLCFQLPGLLLEGTTLVVSPLIALMQDQTDKLEGRDVSAAKLDSTLRRGEARALAREIRRGAREIVYVTPERLSDPAQLEALRGLTIDLFVVDEAHCVSQWGHDFRPAYLGLKEAIAALGRPPVMALTATAPPRVAEDIRAQLGMRDDARVVSAGVERENLFLEVKDCTTRGTKRARVLEIARAAPGATGIVYCATIRTVSEVHAWLAAEGVSAERYHGKLRADEREEAQRRFMSGETPVMVATSAFGMGIDKPDVRWVVHWNLPDSVETYVQEAGRAGRDGEQARAVLLYRRADRSIQSFFLGGRYPSRAELRSAWGELARAMPDPVPVARLGEVCGLGTRRAQVVAALLEEMGVAQRRRGAVRKVREFSTPEDWEAFLSAYERRRDGDRARLEAVVRYAQTALCRMQLIRDYFGEEKGDRCGNCDSCRDRSGIRREILERQAEDAARPGLVPAS